MGACIKNIQCQLGLGVLIAEVPLNTNDPHKNYSKEKPAKLGFIQENFVKAK